MTMIAERPATRRRATAVRDRATAYASRVVAGELVAGELVRKACQRHLDDLATAEARGLAWDIAEAEWSIDFYPASLRHWKGELGEGDGQPVVLEPWQEFIVGSAFGWKWAATGLRRFRLVYVEVAKKQGKTLMASGFGLRLAFFDNEPGAEVYSVATKHAQAKIVWNDAKNAVTKSPALSRRLEITESKSNIHDLVTGSKFEPLGKDSRTGEQGINPHGGIIDELHVAAERDTWDNLESAMASRRQPMRLAITTAGVKREGIWSEVRRDVVSIIEDRNHDDSVFGYVATLDEGDDPFDEAVWPKANPNVGVSVSWDFLREKAAIAKRSPGALSAYMRYHMNTPTQQSTRWIAIDVWDTGNAAPQVEPGQACYAGLDLASVRDLTAFVMVFRAEDGTYDLVCRFWCPAVGIEERSRRDGVPYADWVRDGYLIATEGNVTDYDVVFAEIQRLAAQYWLTEIAFDRWNATQLATQLTNDGAALVPVSQTYSGLSAASKELEKAVLSGRLRHGGNPVLRWMAGNVELEIDANENIRPSKARSTERIDGIVALVMGISRWMALGEPATWAAA